MGTTEIKSVQATDIGTVIAWRREKANLSWPSILSFTCSHESAIAIDVSKAGFPESGIKTHSIEIILRLF